MSGFFIIGIPLEPVASMFLTVVSIGCFQHVIWKMVGTSSNIHPFHFTGSLEFPLEQIPNDLGPQIYQNPS